MNALEARALSYRYPSGRRHALDDLSLCVREGRPTGLLGPNGAGKTTFFSLICGLLHQESGELRVFGMRSTDREARRSVGYCPQELALYPKLTAEENLRFFGRLAGLSGRHLSRRVNACLEISRLGAEAATRVEGYSGGMKRRLNLGLALMHGPKLLLLDEPTVGVDTPSRNAIFEALEDLAKEGTTIIYATHYMEEVERFCEDVAVIDRGRVIASGATAEIVGGGALGQTYRLKAVVGQSVAVIVEEAKTKGLEAHALGLDEIELSGGDMKSLTAEVARLAGLGVVSSVETHRPTLEERFLELTGQELRD